MSGSSAEYAAALDRRKYDLRPRRLPDLAGTAAMPGIVALLMASGGLYGVTSYSVAMRGWEIAVRMARGARGDRVVTMVLRQVMTIATIGSVLGGLAGIAAGIVIRAEVFGVRGVDVAVLAATAALLAVACASPAFSRPGGPPSEAECGAAGAVACRMAPLIVLAAVTSGARLAGQLGVRALRDWAAATRAGLAVMFCFTAAAHFNGMRADLVRMVPPGVPYPEAMVTFTGVCEILGALGLIVPATRRLAAFALVALLLSVLPANIHAALAGVTLRGAAPTPLAPRIALQALFVFLLWWSAIRRPPR